MLLNQLFIYLLSIVLVIIIIGSRKFTKRRLYGYQYN